MTNAAYRAASREKAEQILSDTMSDMAVFGALFELAATGKRFAKVIATNVED